MLHWIDALCEPKKLFLTWQPGDLSAPRTRWAVGLVQPAGDDLELRYFGPGREFDEYNPGRTFDELLSYGYAGYPAFSPQQILHREGVKAALMRRLPPRQRSDFGRYMAQFRLKSGEALSDLALLGRTEAKLPSDGYSLVDPLDPAASRCDLLLEVAGFRHYAPNVRELELGDPILIRPEPENPYDPGAVVVLADGQKIGNVNRLQAPTFLHWLRKCDVEASLERLNGTSERPRAYMFVRVSPSEARRAA